MDTEDQYISGGRISAPAAFPLMGIILMLTRITEAGGGNYKFALYI